MNSREMINRRHYRLAVMVTALLWLAGPVPAFAENKSKLVVTVTAEADGSPVPGARILITDPDNLDMERTGSTDSQGNVTFRELPRKKLKVQVFATGLESHGEKVKLSDKTEKMTVTLKKSDALPAEATAVPKRE